MFRLIATSSGQNHSTGTLSECAHVVCALTYCTSTMVLA